jgi:hypothetical protein
MQRIFVQGELPRSFKLLRVKHSGYMMLPSPDGPPAVSYEASVSAEDYPRLVNRADSSGKRVDESVRSSARWAVFCFDPALDMDIISAVGTGMRGWTPLIVESWSTATLATTPYVRLSHIIVDDRASDTMRLFITTHVPYDDPRDYPPLRP